MTWQVYALCQPGTHEVRYVGKSNDPQARLASHMSDNAAEAIREWMRAIRYRPELRILQDCESEAEALEAEKKWVAEYWSGRLLNSYAHAGRPNGSRPKRFTGFGERLRQTRKSKGLTTTKLQELTGIRYGSISNMENKGIEVSASCAVLLARALGVSVEYLVTGES